MDPLERSWLLDALRQERPELASTVLAARAAAQQAWDGVHCGWFLDCGPAHADRLIAFLGEFLYPCRLSLRDQLPPSSLCSLLCAAYLYGNGLARALAARGVQLDTEESYRRLSATAAADGQPEPCLDSAGDPTLPVAVGVLCRALRCDQPLALRDDPHTRALRAGDKTPYRLPLLGALLFLAAELDRHPSRSAPVSLEVLPESLALRHAVLQYVREVTLVEQPDGRRRPRVVLAFPSGSDAADAFASWLERDMAQRIRQVEPVLRADLPGSCRLAPMPVCVYDRADAAAPPLPQEMASAARIAMAKARVPGRSALVEALANFVARDGAGLAVLQDHCGRDSDVAWLVAFAEEKAQASGVVRVVHVDCAAGRACPTLADVLGQIAAGLGVAFSSPLPLTVSPGAADESRDPAGAASPQALALVRALLQADVPRSLVSLLHITALRREDLHWLGQRLIGPLLEAQRPNVRFLVHGAARLQTHRLLDFFPGVFDLIGELSPFSPVEYETFLRQQGGYPEAEAAERAQRAMKLTAGRPRNTRVLLLSALYGQPW